LGISQVSPRSRWSPRDCHEFCTHAPAGAERVEDPQCEMPSAIRIFQPAGGNSQETSLAPLAGQTPDGDITISASSLLSAASCLGLRVSHGLMIRPAAKNHSNPPRFTLLATSKRHPTDFAKILDFQARVKPPSSPHDLFFTFFLWLKTVTLTKGLRRQASVAQGGSTKSCGSPGL